MRWKVPAACGVAVLALSAPASANPLDEAVAHLRDTNVYVGADSPTIDQAAVVELLDRTKVAIVPPGGPDPVTVAQSIGSELEAQYRDLTVLVFEGHSYGAASTAKCDVGAAIDEAVDRNRTQLQRTEDVTATVRDFAISLQSAPDAADGCNGEGSPAAAADDSGGGGLSTFWAVVLLAVAAVALFLWFRRRRRLRELSDAKAAAMPFYQRLGSDLTNLKGGDNARAAQALRDAADRYAAAGAQLAAADSVPKYEYAARTAVEGLYAVRAAREALGLDPGPPLPALGRADAEYLDRPREVTVGDQTYQGFPGYTPGAPYYFGGGYGIPGGWYGFPFWETLLVGSMLGGGLGWGMGGWGMGGYGMGYDNGYMTGYDAGEAADGADAGWGDSGGGGTWDSGWGDSGGGWDGGGDFGGGDFGGGDGGGGW